MSDNPGGTSGLLCRPFQIPEVLDLQSVGRLHWRQGELEAFSICGLALVVATALFSLRLVFREETIDGGPFPVRAVREALFSS